MTPRTCAQCGTELASGALACPACHALVHAERLRGLAARAEAYRENGALEQSRDAWRQSLDLLPERIKQHEVISARVAALDARLAAAPGDAVRAKMAAAAGLPWYRRWGAGAGAVAIILLSKAKFLLLGLTKLKTLISMFAFFGVYWTAFGWPLALGFVVGIYIHEMGHVAMLRRLGIDASAPMFIPGVGAFILAKKHITDPRQDAAVDEELAPLVIAVARDQGVVQIEQREIHDSGSFNASLTRGSVIGRFNSSEVRSSLSRIADSDGRSRRMRVSR